MRQHIGIMVISCALLAACSSRQTATITPTERAINSPSTITYSPTRVNPTLTTLPSLTTAPSPTVIPSPSPINTPSPKPKPSLTRRPRNTPSPTMLVEETATNSAERTQSWATRHVAETMEGTWIARAATEVAILPGCQDPYSHDYSPDGDWVVVLCMDKDNPTGVYNRKNPTLAWLLDSKTIFNDELHRWAMYRIYTEQWTGDGRYLYLSIHPCCYDGPCLRYFSGIALIRLDLFTGSVTKTIPPVDYEDLYHFSFSADGTHLAYLATWYKHPVLNLENLVTGEVRHIPLGELYNEAGDIVWSPDFTQIVFSARTGEDCEHLTNYLVMMDLDTYEQTVLLESNTDDYYPIKWTADNQIWVYLGYDALYNLSTGELTPYLTPTPTMYP
jgi:hypothetical protein